MLDEIVIVAQVVVVSAALVLEGFGVYRLIGRNWGAITSFVREAYRPADASDRDWDRAPIVYRVPGSTIAFLCLEYLVLWITIGFAADGISGLGIDEFFSLWYSFVSGLDGFLGIVGVLGTVCATVYGVHQDPPEQRYATLGVLAVFGVLIGLDLRFD